MIFELQFELWNRQGLFPSRERPPANAENPFPKLVDRLHEPMRVDRSPLPLPQQQPKPKK